MWPIEVYNRSPTSACKSDGHGNSGSAPCSALGLECNLQDLVPFGNRCVVHVGKRLKKDLSSRLVRIIGFAVDTPGFIVVLEDDDGKIRPTSQTIATVHVQLSRARQLWTTDGTGFPFPPLLLTYVPIMFPCFVQGGLSHLCLMTSLVDLERRRLG